MVKDEPGEEPEAAPAAPEKKQKKKKRTEDLELHTYEEDELKRFKQREMVADAELLDGGSSFLITNGQIHIYC